MAKENFLGNSQITFLTTLVFRMNMEVILLAF